MNEKFKLHKNMYLIFLFVFIFGMLIELTSSNYVLRFFQDRKTMKQEEIKKLPEELKSSLSMETFLIITNPKSPESHDLSNNINQTLKYMHKESVEATADNLPNDLEKFSGIIITFEQIDFIHQMSRIERFVAEGGSVFFAIRPGFNEALFNVYRKLGIFEVGNFVDAHGIKMTSNLLINQKGLEINNHQLIENSSLALGIEKSCRVHAESVNHVPLLWDVSYKKGKFIVFNGTMLSSKENRGLIAGAVSLMKEDFIYPIMNMKLAYIDDFPAPIPEGYTNEVNAKGKIKSEAFYQNIWWPFIQEGAKEYDVKYAGVVIQTYNDRVRGPFSNDIGEQQETLIKYGRDLLKMGGEIGIHGYNHQSLTTSKERIEDLGYKSWGNQMEMEASLKELEGFIKRSFPNIDLSTYVPPSNIIDDTGLSAIRSTLPSVKIISSLYVGDGSNTYNQEFNYDDDFIHLPRITSGYEYKSETKWSIANTLTSIGVFSHFIHPDDIFDEERTSKKTWAELSGEYNKMLYSIKQSYPWLRSMLPSEGAQTLQQYNQADIYLKESPGKLTVYCDNFTGKAYFLLRTNKKVTSLKDCSAKKIDDGVYLVVGKKEIFEIGLVK